MSQLLALVVVIAVAALAWFVVAVTRAALDRAERRSEVRIRAAESRTGQGERPSVDEGLDAWRQWAAYYRGLAEHAHAEGSTDSAATYEGLARTYRVLAGEEA